MLYPLSYEGGTGRVRGAKAPGPWAERSGGGVCGLAGAGVERLCGWDSSVALPVVDLGRGRCKMWLANEIRDWSKTR